MVVSGTSRRRRLDGEVPVREGKLWIDKLQTVLERVGQKGVAGQETETVMELPKTRPNDEAADF